MCATAQLDRVLPGVYDPDPVAVLLAEERDRARRLGFVAGRHGGLDRLVGDDLARSRDPR